MIRFGTDGWRAIIAEDFTFDNVKIMAQATADYYNSLKKNNHAVIGFDRRFMSPDFARTASQVFAANAIKVTLAQADCPTPTVSFECLYSKYDFGIMITASHNPYRFNGYKIKTAQGGGADKSVTGAVEKFLHKNKVKETDFDTAVKNGQIKIENFTSPYVKFLRGYVDIAKIKQHRLKVLVDTMHGVGSNYIAQVLGKCGIKIDYIHDDFNPGFEGISPEPIAANLKELMEKVKKEKYTCGLCLDGDADRIAMVDSQGNFVNAQVLLPLLAIHMIKNRKEKGGIGKTVVGSNLIDDVALDLNVPCYETPVGFKYLSNLFKEGVICIGGEEAGGIGFNGYIPERDGSMSFLLILEMMAFEKKTFDQLLNDMYKKYGRWYYSRTAISVKSIKKQLSEMKLPKEILGNKVERVNSADGIKLITKKNWLMFRQSGTEPNIRVYAEAKSEAEAKRLVTYGTQMVYAL